jgi:hypothetical protein
MARRRHAAPTASGDGSHPTDGRPRYAAIAKQIVDPRVRPIPADFLPLLECHGRYVIDGIRVPFGEKFLICNTDFRVLTGTKASICPRAKPSVPVELVGALAASLRRRQLIPRNSTIHWIGRQETVESTCCCDPEALQRTAEGRPEPVKERLEIQGSTVKLDGQTVPLNLTSRSRAAVICLLTHLLAARGDWRSQSELYQMEGAVPCRDHVGIRWYRIVALLPATLRALIETNRRKGNRLRPTIFQQVV